jgi:hypothetical protein
MNYEQVKEKIALLKPVFVLAACFVLVFVVGFGIGRYDREQRRLEFSQQINYSTKEDEEANIPQPEKATTTPAVMGAETGKGDCPVKGNIGSKGKKTYHIIGGAFYDRTNPEQCFKTETEARAAGFVKSSR